MSMSVPPVTSKRPEPAQCNWFLLPLPGLSLDMKGKEELETGTRKLAEGRISPREKWVVFLVPSSLLSVIYCLFHHLVDDLYKDRTNFSLPQTIRCTSFLSKYQFSFSIYSVRSAA